MTSFDVSAAFPLLALAATPVVVMLAIAVRRSHAASVALTTVGLISALIGLAALGVHQPARAVSSLLTMDSVAVFGMGLFILATLAVVLLSYDYLGRYPGWHEEYYVLLSIATLGAAVLVASNHFASLFLGLETLSVSLYALIAFFPQKQTSLEAGLKYLVLAAATSAFLLFGMALIYAEVGTLQLDVLPRISLARPEMRFVLVAPGVTLILVGIGFKLALVPFHMWTPDIYQGAPAPVAAFVATVSKGGILLLLLRFFHATAPATGSALQWVLAILAVFSMLAGNLLALLQQNVKRILAYSSIGHLGFLLVSFQAEGPLAANAAAVYLVAYFVTMLGAFAVVSILSTPGHEAEMLDDYRGLFWRRPLLAGVFTLMLLSLAGIPLTAGFIGKFWVLSAGAVAAAWVPVIVLVAASTVGLYYYLRIVVVMVDRAPVQAATAARLAVGETFALGTLAVFLVWLGFYPNHLFTIVRVAMAGLWR